MMRQKICIIGLDGFSWNVVDAMTKSGFMPFLHNELKMSKKGILLSTDPPITPAAWTSFATGLLPEEHNVRGFRNFQFRDTKLTYELNNSSYIRYKNLWQILSERNRRVCVVNLPLTYPPFEVNGIVVSGFPVPLIEEASFTYPLTFQGELLNEIPDYQPPQWGDGAYDVRDGIQHFVERMIAMSSQRARLGHYLLNKEEWDVFMIHFQETDFLQHRFWHCIDQDHPSYSKDGFLHCAYYYKYLDGELSKIVALARKNGYAPLFISDHGFQRSEYDININNWLYRKGFLYLNRGLMPSSISLLENIARFMPRNLKLKLKRTKKKVGLGSRYLEKSFLENIIDYKHSAAFVETNYTNIAYVHFFRDDPAVKEKLIKNLSDINLPNGEKLVNTISPYPNNNNVYKIVFAENVVASGTIINNQPWCKKPRPGKNLQVGVHHKEGIIIADQALLNQGLPHSIHQLFRFILIFAGITDITNAIYSKKPRLMFTDKENKKVEESLKNLGYL